MTKNLPLNWCECKLVDICDVYQPKTISTKELIEDGKYTVYGANGVIGRYNQYNHENSEILITCRGATCGTINKSKPFSWINGNAMVVHPFIKLSSDFLFYYLNSVNFKPYISGSAQPQITRISLQPLSLPLPPLAEQERIVEKIEALFQDIDEGVERLKSAQAQIKQYRQSVLKSAFEGKLYKTTEWKKSTLEQHIQEINYGTSEKTKDFGKIPVFRMGDIQEGKLTFNNFKYLNKINDEKLILKKGDLLFNRTNSAELVGKSAVFNHEGSYSFASYIIKVRFDTSLDSNFICYYINSPKGRNWAKTQISQQVGQANINGTKLKNLPFPLPTLPEQQRIVEEIEKRFAVADVLEKAVNEGLEKADKLKQSILKKAFEGKLAPQNPNDEPASILLERIKKSQTPTKGKKK